MSQNHPYPEIDYALVEKSMRKARIERSKAVWSLLQNLFSKPETRDTADNEFRLKPSLRLG